MTLPHNDDAEAFDARVEREMWEEGDRVERLALDMFALAQEMRDRLHAQGKGVTCPIRTHRNKWWSPGLGCPTCALSHCSTLRRHVA